MQNEKFCLMGCNTPASNGDVASRSYIDSTVYAEATTIAVPKTNMIKTKENNKISCQYCGQPGEPMMICKQCGGNTGIAEKTEKHETQKV